MANITKQNRDRMLAFIKQMKEQHNDDASIVAFNEIENYITEKKFGLIFEEHTEAADEMLHDHIPVYCADNTRNITNNSDLPYNFIIEGDNLHALYLLEKTHKGKVDCIYIDPPYNTGAKDWKYNNDYVDSNDSYRHSKWLSMMSSRLKIAKKLLASDGCFICAIDENEIGDVLLLISDIFGQAYICNPITIIHNPRGVQGDNFSYVHEYAIFVYKRGSKVVCTKELSQEEIDWSPLRNWGTESERLDAANCFYPIYVKDGKIIGFGDDVTSLSAFHPQRNMIDKKTGIVAVYPIDNEGIERKWRYARQTVESIVDLLRVKDTSGVLDIELGKDFAPYRTVWSDKKYDANEYGTQLIKSMVKNCDFSFPKSLYNVYECLYAITKNKPNAVILDFFAGSGTTGHACLLLNKNLGGNRKFILCTNNEVGEKREKEYKLKHSIQKFQPIDKLTEEWKNWEQLYGIASSVTYPRIRSAINGFIHTKDFKVELYRKKLSVSVIKKMESILKEISNIENSNINEFSTVKTLIEDDCIIVQGITKKGLSVEGLSSNLKYFKCDWVDRRPQEYLLSNALCLHIKEMIELQNFIEVDNRKYVLILNKKDFFDHIVNNEHTDEIQGVWVNQNIVFSAEEVETLEKYGFRYIPREFFGQELKEVAE